MGLLLGAAALAADNFSKNLTPEQFAAAGLNKLTPEELARLDALVHAQQTGELAKAQADAEAQEQAAVARARAEASAKVQQETEAKVRAELAAQEKTAPKKGERVSLLGRMKVLLTPGAEVEYAKVETKLAGPFHGYRPGTILNLDNGQSWQVIDDTYWSPKSEANKPRRVVISPGSMGSFFLDIEGAGSPRVKLVSNGK